MGFFQAKYVLIKVNSLFQVGDPVTGVKELLNHRLKTATNESRRPSTRNKIRAANFGICETGLIYGSF